MPRANKTVDGFRQCSVCKQTKPVEEFGMNGRWHKSYCRECGKNERKIFHDWVISLKDKPCTDCGRAYPARIMEFDHVPERGPKIDNVRSIGTREKVLIEVEKCDVVCPTCHTIRTATRAGLLTEEELDVLSKL